MAEPSGVPGAELAEELTGQLGEKLGQQLSVVTQIYDTAIEHLVPYSFQLLGALVVIIAGVLIARFVSKLVLRLLEAREVDVTLRQFIASTVRLLMIIMFTVIAVQQLGIDITPLIAAIGGLAVGLSLALQGPVSNYGAGLVIILTRMYRVGDTITTQGCTGQVEEISLASTELRAEDGELIVIPNKHILGEIHSNSDTYRIVEGVIGVAYDSDVTKAIATIETVLDGQPGINSDAEPEVGICDFGDSGINIEYRYWTETASHFKTVHAVNLAILEAFRAGDVQIPFPQREVRVLSG